MIKKEMAEERRGIELKSSLSSCSPPHRKTWILDGLLVPYHMRVR